MISKINALVLFQVKSNSLEGPPVQMGLKYLLLTTPNNNLGLLNKILKRNFGNIRVISIKSAIRTQNRLF